MDHTRALRSIISGLPRDWKRPPWRPQRTWLRTNEQDLRPLNIGLVSAWQRAQDRERWRRTVETAMLQAGHAFDDDDHNATIINRKQVGLEVDLECRDFVLHSNVC